LVWENNSFERDALILNQLCQVKAANRCPSFWADSLIVCWEQLASGNAKSEDSMLVPLLLGGGKVQHVWVPVLPAMKKSMIDCRGDQSCVLSTAERTNQSALQDDLDVCLIV
jgi:hypothetical protein